MPDYIPKSEARKSGINVIGNIKKQYESGNTNQELKICTCKSYRTYRWLTGLCVGNAYKVRMAIVLKKRISLFLINTV